MGNQFNKGIAFFSTLFVSTLVVLFFGIYSYTRFAPQSMLSSKIKDTTETVLGIFRSSRETQRFIYISDKKGYMSGGVVTLASTDEPTVKISSWSLSGEADVELYQSNKDQLLQYLTHNNKGEQIHSMNVTGLQLLTKLKHTIKDKGEPQLLSLPLEANGIYLIKIGLNGVTEYGFVVRSSIGSILKNSESDFLIWTRSFENLRAVTSGTVRIFNLENQPTEIATSAIDGEGIARNKIMSEADIALIESGGHIALVPINLKYLNSSYEYKQYQQSQIKRSFFTFTDRPIYQPGDTVYFKSIIRNDNDAVYTIPEGSINAVVVEGYSESGTKLCPQSITISDTGAIDGFCKIPENAGAGYYSVEIKFPQNTSRYDQVSSVGFQVEHYRKPEYSVDITTNKTSYTNGDKMEFTVNGAYFYGQPLANVKVKYTVTSADYYMYNYDYEYINRLSDEHSYSWYGGRGSTEYSGEVDLDASGQAIISVVANTKNGKNKVIGVEVTVADDTQNQSFSRKNVLVYAGEFGLFKKEYQSSFKINQSQSIGFTARSWQDGKTSDKKIQTKITRTWYQLTNIPGQKYPLFEEQTEILPDQEITTNNQGVAILNFTPTQAGSYRLDLTTKDDRGNTITNTFYLYVYREDVAFYNNQSRSDYELILDKEKYGPNDTVNLLVISDTSNQDVLLTLERAYVHRYQLVHLNNKQTTIAIPLEPADTPDIYAAISGFDDQTFLSHEQKISIPPIHKQLAITITTDRKTYGPGDTVNATVQTRDVAGNPKSSEVTLWAIDKSLFELAASNTGDIVDTFWRERFNYTSTSHSLEGISVLSAEAGGGCFTGDTQILMANGSTKAISDIHVGDLIKTRVSENDSSITNTIVLKKMSHQVPGIMIINGVIKVTPEHKVFLNGIWQPIGNAQIGDALINSQNQPVNIQSIEWQLGDFNVFNLETAKYHTFIASDIWVHNQKGDVRSVLKDAAYWNPSLHTDDNGQASVQFKLPDNLTTWSLAAVGATSDTIVGQASSEIVVTKNVIVRPVIPNIIRTGDSIQLAAYVHNYTDTAQTFDVSIKFTDMLIENHTQKIKIDSQKNQLVTWQVSPTVANNDAKVTIKAIAVDNQAYVDGVSISLPVIPYGYYTNRSDNKYGNGSFTLQLTEGASRDHSKITLSLAPTLMGNVLTALEGLVGYPYGCSEQTTSKLMAALIAKDAGVLEKALKDADYNLDDITNEAYDRLTELQLPDGSWGWWRDSSTQLYVTTYVAESLGRSRIKSQKHDTITSKVTNFYKQLEPKNVEEAVLKTYALTFLDPKTKGIKLDYKEFFSDDILAMAAIANSKNGHGTALLDNLISRATAQGNGIFWKGNSKENFGDEIASTGFALQALSLGGEKYQNESAKAVWYLLQSRKQRYWSTTFSSIQVMKGLIAYTKSNNELDPNFNYTITQDGQVIKQGSINDANQLIETISIDPKTVKPEGSTIAITMEGEGQLYSTLSTDELHQEIQSEPEENGFELTRRYISDSGSINSFGVGDLVTVELKISKLNGDMNYLAIEDQLPSGMIPVNTHLKNEQRSNSKSRFSDEQDITLSGMVLAASSVRNERIFTYKARVIAPGVFNVPPATAQAMYAPENYSRTDGLTITITENSSDIIGPKGKYTTTKPKDVGNPQRPLYGLIVLFIIASGIGTLIYVKKKHKKNDSTPTDITDTQRM